MSTLQEQQKPIDASIVNAMIESTPEEWSVIELTLHKENKDKNTGEFTHELSSPEGYPPVSPEMSLYEATYKLDDLMKSHRAFIKRAVYIATYNGENWSYTAEFEYYD